MKLRITPEDLTGLTQEQQRRLQYLWVPKPFEHAIAYICTDVSSDHYEAKEFIIGRVECSISSVGNDTSVILYDLSQINTNQSNESEEPEIEEPELEDDWVEVDESALTKEMQLASPCFLKEFCLPLFDIGQLLELLQRLKYGDEYFYLTINSDPESLSSLGRDHYGPDYEEEEICEMLWECIKEHL